MKKILLFSVTALLVFACGQKPEEKAKETTATQEEVVEVKVQQVKVRVIKKDTIDVQQEYTAAINSFDRVYLAPTVPGRIVDIKVEVTDEVKKGQLVVLMDEAQLHQLEVQYKNLLKEMSRMDTLIAYGSVSQQAYDQLESQLVATKTSYRNLKENTRLVSPFNGVVTERHFDDTEVFSGGPSQRTGKSAILTIEQIEKLKVQVNVSARYFPVVTKGLSAKLTTDIYPGQTFDGEVSLVYPTIDPATRTFTVELIVPNADLTLRPGMYAKVKIKLAEKEALVVPSSTVLMQEGTANRYIFVLEDGKAKRIPVTLGERFDDKLEIIADVELEGKQLIVAGQSKLENGDAVGVE